MVLGVADLARELTGLYGDLKNREPDGAHIDDVVHSDGIYTGNNRKRRRGFTKDDAYTLSRMVKPGPFTYPHIVAIFVTRHLVGSIAKSFSAYGTAAGASANRALARRAGATAMSSIADRLAAP